VRLGVRAQDTGRSVVVTHAFDGPIAMAAAAEVALALATRKPLRACGLDPHPGLKKLPKVAIPQLARRGRVIPSGRAGIGIEI